MKDDTSPLYSFFYKIEPDLKPRLKACHPNLRRIGTFSLNIKRLSLQTLIQNGAELSVLIPSLWDQENNPTATFLDVKLSFKPSAGGRIRVSFPHMYPHWWCLCGVCYTNLPPGDITSSRPEALGEGAHHHVHVRWVHTKQFGHAPARRPHGADAVGLVQVQVGFILFLQCDNLCKSHHRTLHADGRQDGKESSHFQFNYKPHLLAKLAGSGFGHSLPYMHNAYYAQNLHSVL